MTDHHAEPAAGEEEYEITNEFVEAVELEVGMGHGAWDCVGPMSIIAAVLKHSPELDTLRRDIAELRRVLAEAHEREKFERAGRANAEHLAEVRLRHLNGLVAKMKAMGERA
jgi:hypothetical protein